MQIQEETRKAHVGLHFCDNCRNILTPLRANEQSLEFICRNCRKCQKDFSRLEDLDKLVYSKTSEQVMKEERVDQQQLFEPMNTRVKAVCKDCQYEQAIFCMRPEKSQSNIEIYLYCNRTVPFVCENFWKLDDDQPIPPRN